MKKFDIYCGGRKSFIFIQDIMKLKKIFHRSKIFIKESFQIDLFFFIFNIFKFITKFIVALVLSHVITALSDILSLLAHNSNSCRIRLSVGSLFSNTCFAVKFVN